MGFSFDFDGFMDDLRVIKRADLPPELSQRLARGFLDRSGRCSGCDKTVCSVSPEEEAFAEGFKKAFWYVLAEIERKTTVDEILSWFAKKESFCPIELRCFEVPDYDLAIEDVLMGRRDGMRKIPGGKESEKKR